MNLWRIIHNGVVKLAEAVTAIVFLLAEGVKKHMGRERGAYWSDLASVRHPNHKEPSAFHIHTKCPNGLKYDTCTCDVKPSPIGDECLAPSINMHEHELGECTVRAERNPNYENFTRIWQ